MNRRKQWPSDSLTTGEVGRLQPGRRAQGGDRQRPSEAIYATRILPPYQEGKVCDTRSKDGRFAYAICTEWPGRNLTLKGIRVNEGATITMLGVAKPLKWEQTGQGLTISIPEKLQDEKARPCEYAWAIKISMHCGTESNIIREN